jgi:hypothetical protein
MDYTEQFRMMVCLSEAPDLAACEQARTNLLSVPEIAERTKITVSPEQIKVSWKERARDCCQTRADVPLGEGSLTGAFCLCIVI